MYLFTLVSPCASQPDSPEASPLSLHHLLWAETAGSARGVKGSTRQRVCFPQQWKHWGCVYTDSHARAKSRATLLPPRLCPIAGLCAGETQLRRHLCAKAHTADQPELLQLNRPSAGLRLAALPHSMGTLAAAINTAKQNKQATDCSFAWG